MTQGRTKLNKYEQLMEIIQSRQSIRKYKPELPSRELIEKVLQAGFWAPSGKNRQNWKFFVITGKKRDQYLQYSQKTWAGVKDTLQKKLKPSLYEFTERFFYTLGEAPCVIFCYTLLSKEERDLTSIGSVYMAVENMNLAAVALGLGCCTMGAPLEIEKDIDQFLQVDQLAEYKSGELKLLCGMTLGFPDHAPPRAARQIEGRVTWIC